MRKFGKIAAITVAGFMLFAFTNILDSSFEGVITYSINLDSDANPQVAQMMQGSNMKIYIKGDMSRTENNFGMYKTISIVDRKKPSEPIMLIDMMGNKYQLKMDDKMKKQADESKPDIKYLDGTKTIAGYLCKEAQVTVADKKTGNKYTSDIYYTDQIYSSAPQTEFKGLKGLPLSYSMKQSGTSFSMVCQSVQKQSVPDSLFATPPGYKLMTQEEMQKDMMSHMGGGGGQ